MMPNKIDRAVLYIVFMGLYAYMHIDGLVDKTLPNVWGRVIEVLLSYLPILYILCYGSICTTLSASALVSLLSLVASILTMLLLSLLGGILPAIGDKLSGTLSIAILIILPVIYAHLFGRLVNYVIKAMKEDE